MGVLVGRVWGFDPREVGSGNIGTTNVARAGGKLPAAVTFGADVLKGFVPVKLAQLVFAGCGSGLAANVEWRSAELCAEALALVGLATFAGSIASVFLKLRGGRGVATSLGVWLGLAPVPIGIAVAIFAVVVVLARIVSLASLVAALSLPPATAALQSPRPYILLAIVMTALVLLRHRENIARIIRGEEPTIGAPPLRKARN